MNSEQRNEEIARSLSRAGIGMVYHQKTLSEYGKAGDAVKDCVNEPGFKVRVASGFGFNLLTSSPTECAFPFVVARAMRLKRIDVRVARLLPLLDFIERGHSEDFSDDRFRDFESRAQALVIPAFIEKLDERPLGRRELYRIEGFLSELMDNGFSVSVQHFIPLEQQDWFSHRFVQTLKERNMGVAI